MGQTTLRQDLSMIGKFLSIRRTADPAERVRKLYQVYQPERLLTDRTTYFNLGYWKPGCASLDDASEALANLLADQAGMTAGDLVLDVGYGYGDQDFLWWGERGLKGIVGLNITPDHVKAARARAEREGVADRIDFQEGSATAMPVGDGVFDRVVALESAFHFYSREDFFREAYRVLRPGGVLATADILPVDGDIAMDSLKSSALHWITFTYDAANWYPAADYTAKLRAAGFEEAGVTSIRDNVYPAWQRFNREKVDDPAFKRRTSRMFQRMLRIAHANQEQLSAELAMLDYVIAVARKPLAD